MAPVRPAVQPSTENYPAQQHEHMKNLVNQNYDPNAAPDVIEAWAKFGTKFRELANDFNKIVNDSQAGWSGQAADGVRQALTKVGQFTDNTGTAFHETAKAISIQHEAAVNAHNSMPDPVEYNPLKIMGKWGGIGVLVPGAMAMGPIEMIKTHNEQQDAKSEAVQVMQQRDTTMLSAAQAMPAMEATPQVTQDQGTTQTSSTTTSHSLSNVNSNGRFSNNSGMPSMPSNPNNTTTPSWVAPQVTQPNLGNNNQNNNNQQNQNRPPFTPPPGGFPPGRVPPGGPRPPGGGMGRGPGGGGPGGMGGGRGGMGGMGAGGMGAGRGMGSFGPATPGGNAGVMGAGGPGSGSGAGAAGRGGAAGAGGMGGGAGAGQGQGGEDKEHKSNYLIPTDEFFDDDRLVAPPVIGE